MSTADDQEADALLRSAREGREALARLIDAHQGWLTRETRRLFAASEQARGLNSLLGVEGVVQEALLRVWRKAHGFRGTTAASFRAWLRRILRRVFEGEVDRASAARRDWRREARGRHPSHNAPPTAFPDPASSPSSEARHGEDWERLRADLRCLTLRQHVAFMLKVFHGMPDADIGFVMGCTADAAQQARADALARLMASGG